MTKEEVAALNDRLRKNREEMLAALTSSPIAEPSGDEVKNAHDTSALERAIENRRNGCLTEFDKSLLLMSTDSAGQEKLCAEFGIPFPGAPSNPLTRSTT